VKPIEYTIEKYHPEIVYTHHIGDLNIDHQITHRAVLTACRPQPGFCVKEIYAFEVMSSTEWFHSTMALFSPNLFVNISDYWKVKENLLHAYSSEMHPPPHSRSIESLKNLARHRGSCVGVDFAEAFMVVRLMR
jgi:LmbE family N-acetylglucosaminyl deacetylase